MSTIPADEWTSLRRLLPLLLLLSFLLKILLLATSQSMPDGDEAVEGVMAMHVLKHGVHPVYPYGVRYGAGAGLECHLAAFLFRLFGVSGIALKSVGLAVWLSILFVLFSSARRRSGTTTASVACLLFAFAPQAAQWSLKVGGGHQVAVLLCLTAFLCLENPSTLLLAALVLPLLPFVHPIAAPFAVVMAALGVRRARQRHRWVFLSLLALSAASSGLLLWPRSAGVWNPSASRPDLLALLARLPTTFIASFTPNLNSSHIEFGVPLFVALTWLVCVVLAVLKTRTDAAIMWALAGAVLALPLVRADLVAPRHLLIAYPFCCLLLAQWIVDLQPYRRGRWLAAVLVVCGGMIQLRETRNPYIYGPDPQHRGVSRSEFSTVMQTLTDKGIENVYCLDPMLQWNIVFESRERIIARWTDPRDRYPEYPRRVDEARLAGKPVAVVGDFRPEGTGVGPQILGVVLSPDMDVVKSRFPPSPDLQFPTATP